MTPIAALFILVWSTGFIIAKAIVPVVMVPGLLTKGSGALSLGVVLVAVAAVLSLTAGTVLQKTSIAAADLRASSTLQNAGAVMVVGLVAY